MLTRSKQQKYHLLQQWLDDYKEREDYDKYYHGFSEVYENIFISSRDIIRVDDLEELGIKSILSLGLGNKLSESLTNNVIENYLCLDVEDEWNEEPMLAILPETRRYIKESLKCGPVLVHCTAGISRSSTVVIDYLVTNKAMSLENALAHVKDRRNCIEPNFSFLKVLCEVEKTCNN